MTSISADAAHVASFVGGEWVSGGEERTRENPARPGEVVARFGTAGPELVDAAAAAAAQGHRAWSRRTGPERGEVLRRAGDLLDGRAEAIGRDLAREEGKTLAEAIGETRRAAQILRVFAGQAAYAPDGATLPSHSPTTLLYSRRVPIGPVAVITPWNFPIAIPAWKIAPALAFGNAVVWKPAELVPLTSWHLLTALLDAGLPADALAMVLGRGSQVGPALTGDARIAAISFTGSNAVGHAIAGVAAERLAPVQLELGGKNPAVVLADADLALAADQVARGAFMSTGQKCTATSRVIVERPVLEDLVARLVEIADGMRVGDPLDPQVRMGPLVSRAQAESVRRYVDTGAREGERVTGRRPDAVPAGEFIAPVVLTGLPEGSALLREEIFGPVCAVVPADSYEHAVALANATEFGLTASVFTRDLALAMRFAEDIEAGVVKINQESAGVEPQAPFGGLKASASGPSEQGIAAREFYTHWKTVYVDRGS